MDAVVVNCHAVAGVVGGDGPAVGEWHGDRMLKYSG